MVGGVDKWRSLTSASETPVSCFEIRCFEGRAVMARWLKHWRMHWACWKNCGLDG